MSSPTDFDLGDDVVLEATFTQSGAPANPSTVTFTVTDPDGVTTPLDGGTGNGAGVYTATFTPTRTGGHDWTAAASGNARGAGAGHFYVRRAPA